MAPGAISGVGNGTGAGGCFQVYGTSGGGVVANVPEGSCVGLLLIEGPTGSGRAAFIPVIGPYRLPPSLPRLLNSPVGRTSLSSTGWLLRMGIGRSSVTAGVADEASSLADGVVLVELGAVGGHGWITGAVGSA
jgi:hypothetical protein